MQAGVGAVWDSCTSKGGNCHLIMNHHIQLMLTSCAQSPSAQPHVHELVHKLYMKAISKWPTLRPFCVLFVVGFACKSAHLH